MGQKIVIEGTTEDGTRFRPSDWAERVSSSLSVIKNHKVYRSITPPSLDHPFKMVINVFCLIQI